MRKLYSQKNCNAKYRGFGRINEKLVLCDQNNLVLSAYYDYREVSQVAKPLEPFRYADSRQNNQNPINHWNNQNNILNLQRQI